MRILIMRSTFEEIQYFENYLIFHEIFNFLLTIAKLIIQTKF